MLLNGMQEVTGSIPVSSTFKYKGQPILVELFYLIKTKLKPLGEEIALRFALGPKVRVALGCDDAILSDWL